MPIFCDEVGSIESDAQYALLWEVLRQESQQRRFLIVGASATISLSMAQELQKIDASWVRCPERRYPLERNLLEVSSRQFIYDAIVFIACALLRRGVSCLVFLPGKQEIQEVHDAMMKAGMQEHSVISCMLIWMKLNCEKL